MHWIPFLLFAALIMGCERKSEIKVYRLAKAPLEESTPGEGAAMPTNMPSPRSGGGVMQPITRSMPAPPGWEPQPNSQMRQASFLVNGDHGAVVDISLVSLGTSAANVLDNVNRWLSQLGQPSITTERLGTVSQNLTTSLGDVTIVDLAGLPQGADPAKDGRIIAAMAPTSGGTLFFKMRGNAELTEAQKPEFIKWVAAVCNGQTGGAAMGGAAAAMGPPADSAAPQIKWTTPDGWTAVPPTSMRYASFNATEPNGGKVDISVVTFPGDGGSDADNVNRWRTQIGLPPMDDKGIAALVVPVDSGKATFSSLDMTSGDSRVIAAWTRRNGRSWFFKMSGPTPALENEKSKFLDFLRSIDFNS